MKYFNHGGGNMIFELGVKSDPIEYRFSYDWLFALMRRQGVRNLQLGSFFELYSLEDSWFIDLRHLAQTFGIRIKSVFTAHRELGGFFSGDKRMVRAARSNYQRLIEVASILGADYAGSNPGAVLRDRMPDKADGIACYLNNMKELSGFAHAHGLKALTIEPMSCSAEPPTLPVEIDGMLDELTDYHRHNMDSSVPVYLCGDVSHGYADANKKIVHGNMDLFNRFLPRMCEFHFKNTDAIFSSTFGFGPEERGRGIVDIAEIVTQLQLRQEELPVDEFVGYLEIGGPKLGRDYSDPLLAGQLEQSLEHIKEILSMTQ